MVGDTADFNNCDREKFVTIKGDWPKKAVLSVLAASKNANRIGSGQAYLSSDGNLILDGQEYFVGEIAHLYDDKFYKTPPQKMIDYVHGIVDAATGKINALVKTMWQINWKEPKSLQVKKGEKYKTIFGWEDVAERDLKIPNPRRHANVSSGNWSYVYIVEKFLDKPNKEALLQGLYDEAMEKYQFQVGGYLHVVDEKIRLTSEQAKALYRYHANGGQFGLTAVKALGNLEIVNYSGLKAGA